MRPISLTEFVDIVSASGTPKATKVQNLLDCPEYDPAADFYKKIRDIIIEAHKTNKGKEYIDGVMAETSNAIKTAIYPSIISGYKKWWGERH